MCGTFGPERMLGSHSQASPWFKNSVPYFLSLLFEYVIFGEAFFRTAVMNNKEEVKPSSEFRFVIKTFDSVLNHLEPDILTSMFSDVTKP